MRRIFHALNMSYINVSQHLCRFQFMLHFRTSMIRTSVIRTVNNPNGIRFFPRDLSAPIIVVRFLICTYLSVRDFVIQLCLLQTSLNRISLFYSVYNYRFSSSLLSSVFFVKWNNVGRLLIPGVYSTLMFENPNKSNILSQLVRFIDFMMYLVFIMLFVFQ